MCAPEKGAGNAGCTAHPRPLCKTHTVVTTGPPKTPGIPARWLYGLLRALPGDEFLFVTVTSRSTRPGWAADLRRLDISNGCQDHTTWPHAATSRYPLGQQVCRRRSSVERR